MCLYLNHIEIRRTVKLEKKCIICVHEMTIWHQDQKHVQWQLLWLLKQTGNMAVNDQRAQSIMQPSCMGGGEAIVFIHMCINTHTHLHILHIPFIVLYLIVKFLSHCTWRQDICEITSHPVFSDTINHLLFSCCWKNKWDIVVPIFRWVNS